MGAIAPYLKAILSSLAAWGGWEFASQTLGPGTTINVAAEQRGLPKWVLPLGVLVAGLLILRYFFKSK